MALDNFVYDSLFLTLNGGVNHIRVIHALYGAVGGNLDNVERVYRPELVLFGLCRTRHTRKLFIKPEIVLEGYRSVGLVFVLYLDLFLCLYCLVKPVGISSAVQNTAGKFVDYEYFTVVRYDIILVALEKLVRFKRLLYVVVQIGVFDIAEVGYAEEAFRLFRALFGYGYRLILSVDYIVPVFHLFEYGSKPVLRFLLFFVELLFLAGRRFLFGVLFVVVKAARKPSYERVDLFVQLRAFTSLTRNNERRTGFVD